MRDLLVSMLDLLFPSVCPVCRHELLETDSGVLRSPGWKGRPLLHRHCLDDLEPAVSIDLPFSSSSIAVRALLDDGPAWFELLHRAKYGGEVALLDPMADALAHALRGVPSSESPPIVVPLPDDPERRRQRGHSPVARIARRLAARLGWRVREDLLRRRAHRPAQARLDDDRERQRNVSHCFAVGDLASVPASRRLLLVDDQITSGATVASALSCLAVRGHRIAVVALASAARTPRSIDP